jgi:hypothetical protein
MSRSHLSVETTYEVSGEHINVTTKTFYRGHVEAAKRIVINASDPKFVAALEQLGWTPPAPRNIDPRTLDVDREFTRIGELSEAGRAPMMFHIVQDKINVAGVVNAEQLRRLARLAEQLGAA